MTEGRVIAFDAHVGLGEVRAEDGTVYPFHCAEITDGTRQIDVGTAVEFGVVLKLGRHEAMGVRKRP